MWPRQRSQGRGPVPFYPSHSREVSVFIYLFGAGDPDRAGRASLGTLRSYPWGCRVTVPCPAAEFNDLCTICDGPPPELRSSLALVVRKSGAPTRLAWILLGHFLRVGQRGSRSARRRRVPVDEGCELLQEATLRVARGVLRLQSANVGAAARVEQQRMRASYPRAPPRV